MSNLGLQTDWRLIHLVSANTWGGGERYALDVCRHFLTEGRQVTAYTRDSQAVDTMFREYGVDVHHAPLRGYFDLPSALILARQIASDPRPVIIHSHKYKDAFTALLAKKLSRRSDVATVVTRHLVREGKDSRLLRRVYRNLSAQIFVSSLAREKFLSAWDNKPLPFPEERIHVLHNSIYIDRQPLTPIPDSGPVIAMYHGRLAHEKGIETLIRALPRLKGKRTRLWIVGTGDSDYVDSLHSLADSLDVLNMIDWKGHHADVHSLIPKARFGVLPSLAQEAFGLTNIEYMAHGRAQICSQNGAQKEYLTHGENAVFVPPDGPDRLADAMLYLIDNPDRCKELGVSAYQKFYDDLQWDKFTSSLSGIYNSALDSLK